MNFRFIYLLVLLVIINTYQVYAQVWKIDDGFELEDPNIGTYSDLYDHIEILYDSTGTLTYEDIFLNHLQFEKNNTKERFRKDGVYWFKTSIKGSEQVDGKYLFSIGLNIATWPVVGFSMATWPFIDVYIQEGDSVRLLKTGFKRKPGEKEFRNGFSYFWMDLKTNEQKTIYVRLDPDGGYWNQYSIPKSISLYFYDPSSLDLLDGIYILRNFENDPVRKGGSPRLSNLFEVTQIYPDTSCNMNLEDVIRDWDSRSIFYVGSLDKKTCYWAHFNVINPDSINQLRIFNFPKGWQRVTCFIPTTDGKFQKKTIGTQTDQNVLFLTIPPRDTLSLYFKYPIPTQSIFPILNVQDIHEADYHSLQKRTIYKYLILGGLFLPFIFFLIQFFTQKDLLTLYYLVFLLGSTLYLISILDQIPFFDFSPKILKSGIFITSFYSIGSLLSLVGLVKFIHLFLEVHSFSSLLYKIGNIILWFFLFTVLVVQVALHLLSNIDLLGSITIQMYRFGGIIVFAYTLFISGYGLVKKIKFSRALFIAFSPLLVTGICYALVSLLSGMQVYFNLFNVNLLLVEGFILTIVLFGVVIGVRNNSVKGEKIKMQEDMLALQEKVNRQLIKVDNLKDQFLANTSHELRTPLQGIIGLSESLYDREKEKGKRQELGMITSSGKRLANLVNSILDFSKLKTHELKLSSKAIDLRTITDTVLHFCRPLVKDKSLKLINEIDLSSPLVEADEDRVYQILHNLIGNAIKFTSEGAITISAIEVQGNMQVCVMDTGMGIPEDKIDDIFKSFEQVDASITREHGGTGLGLTITKQLIELHGGNIWIESKIDQGTSVYFTLPKSTGDKTRMREQEKLSKVIDPVDEDVYVDNQLSDQPIISTESRFNILIVDDEPINQQVLSNHLARDDFRILQAMNGREALALVENEKPDLILLDIMMPKMSGYEVCKEIREKYLPSELPIIMITAKDQVPDLVEGLASGANDYLAKPFSKDELLARLKTHLNLYHINSAYLRFIPKEFLKALGHDSIIDVALGDQVQGDMTILFSDIRSFTSITEKLSAEESFEFLNEVLSSITPAITSNGGFIDKYIGDAIMALFPSNPEDAIISAIQAQENLAKYNKTRESLGKGKIKIGIGIHTGPLMLGTIGVKDRMDGTVISDAVNLASRLEELNKLYDTSMIVSDSTFKKLKHTDTYHYRFLSYARVKGKENAIKVYEFFDGDEKYEKSMKLKTLPTFKDGIKEYYNQKFTRASVKFQEVIDSYPEDQTAKLFLEKSAQYMVQGVPDHWDGVDIVEKVL